MSYFRRLSDTMLASPQITADQISAAKGEGVTLVVNNRPEGEEDGQPTGDEIEAAAQAAGIDYLAIPIGRSGFSAPQVDALASALARAEGPVLGYCRTGTRTTLLWALAQARVGEDPAAIAAAASEAGYDVAPVRSMMDMFATDSRD